MVYQSPREILKIMREEYINVYEVRPVSFTFDTTLDDLKIRDDDKIFMAQWAHQVMRRLGVKPRNVPPYKSKHNYKMSELVNLLRSA